MMGWKLLLVSLLLFGCVTPIVSQSRDELAIRAVLDENTRAFTANNMAKMEKLWGHDEWVTVFENGYANYGWADYRDHHLGPEMKEIKNGSYTVSDVKVHTSGKTAWATFKYTISGDSEGRHFDGAGLGTAVLEKRNGNWVIVHWHSSAPRRAPAPQQPKP